MGGDGVVVGVLVGLVDGDGVSLMIGIALRRCSEATVSAMLM